jgi:hypothetical protein
MKQATEHYGASNMKRDNNKSETSTTVEVAGRVGGIRVMSRLCDEIRREGRSPSL